MKHQTGDFMLKRLIETEDELDTLYAHLRAVVAGGKSDPTWTGWVHALEMLIPDSEPRLAELQERLRAKGLGGLADRMDDLASDGEAP
jgi:hypothetical protein